MRRKVFTLTLILGLLFSLFSPLSITTTIGNAYATSPRVLFDNSHLETAGNADWTIRGGYSDFADALESRGFAVSEWGSDDSRTALHDGDPDITLDVLQQYDVFVIPEPNDPFTDAEKEAIIQYIENGGSVFFIGDHKGADRNNNGWDAVSVFNEFVSTLGFQFTDDWKSEAPVQGEYSTDAPFMDSVNSIGAWGAGGIDVLSDNVHVAITYSDGTPFVVYGTYGSGSFVAIADSSPFDDGTGTSGDRLYDGWSEYDDAQFAIGVITYLSSGSSQNSGSPDILLVDDDGGASYESYYESALDSLGVKYDEVEVRSGKSLSGVNLSDYSLVIWITGQDYKYTLLPSDRRLLADYINSGGYVALFGPEVGYASVKYGWEDWLSDNFGARYVKGIKGKYIRIYGDYVFSGLNTYVNASSSWVNMLESSRRGFYEDVYDGYDNGFEITGDNTILFGFGLENIGSAAARKNTMNDIVSYFLGN